MNDSDLENIQVLKLTRLGMKIRRHMSVKSVRLIDTSTAGDTENTDQIAISIDEYWQ